MLDLVTLGRQVDEYNNGHSLGIRDCIKEANKISAEWQKKNEKRNFRIPQEQNNRSVGKTVFIEYEDNKGNFSDRLIDIHRLYKKGGDTYIDAYCYLSDGDRTFRLDRILSMREGSRKGRVIKAEDMEEYLTQLYKKPTHNDTAEDLANAAMED